MTNLKLTKEDFDKAFKRLKLNDAPFLVGHSGYSKHV